jgi:hypothetical protein
MKLSEKIKIMLELEEAKSPKNSHLRLDLVDHMARVGNIAHATLGGATIGAAALYAWRKDKSHIDAFASAHPKLNTAIRAGAGLAGLGGLAYIAHKKGWLKKKKQEQEQEPEKS